MSFSLKYPRVAHIGHNVSHAKNKTRRSFQYNLHSVTVKIGDKTEKLRVPTKVLKMLKKSGVTTHYRKPEAA